MLSRWQFTVRQPVGIITLQLLQLWDTKSTIILAINEPVGLLLESHLPLIFQINLLILLPVFLDYQFLGLQISEGSLLDALLILEVLRLLSLGLLFLLSWFFLGAVVVVLFVIIRVRLIYKPPIRHSIVPIISFHLILIIMPLRRPHHHLLLLVLVITAIATPGR